MREMLVPFPNPLLMNPSMGLSQQIMTKTGKKSVYDVNNIPMVYFTFKLTSPSAYGILSPTRLVSFFTKLPNSSYYMFWKLVVIVLNENSSNLVIGTCNFDPTVLEGGSCGEINLLHYEQSGDNK